MSRCVDTRQTMSASARARAYTDEAIGELAQSVLMAFEDAETEHAHFNTANVVPSGWRTSGQGQLCYDIEADGVTPETLVQVSVPLDASEIAHRCGLSCRCESLNNVIRLYADSVPSCVFPVEFTTIQPAER